MGADDPRAVALAFLSAPGFVTAQTKGPGGWIASTGGGGLDAEPESVVFIKERDLPNRVAYNVRFTTRAGMRMRYTLALVQGHDGAWQVLGGAGGSAEDQPENAPKRGHAYANLGGGAGHASSTLAARSKRTRAQLRACGCARRMASS